MADSNDKPLTLYPVTVNPKDSFINGEDLLDWLQVQNVILNSKSFKHRGNENLYSIIVDKIDSERAFGRFVKLKKDNVEKLISQGEKFEEKLEIPKENEYIEANSYFVWHLNNHLMLAEYNTDSVNILTGTSSAVLNSSLSKHQYFKELLLEPFPSSEFIRQIIDDQGVISRYYLSFDDVSKGYLESLGMEADLIWEIAEKNTLGLNMAIRLDVSKTLTVKLYEMLTTVADKIRRKAKKFVVYTDEGNFDLIGEKFIYYNETAKIKDEIEAYREEIFKTISEALAERTPSLQGVRKQGKNKPIQKDLERFF